MTWTATVNVYLIVLSSNLIIAIAFAAMGLWPILPFTGLEMLVLAIVFYRCAHRAKYYEVIAIDNDHIKIERGLARAGEAYSFQRYWARVNLMPAKRRNLTSKLLIRSHGQSLEVGAWLNEEEREGLAKSLSRLINHQQIQK